MTILLEGVVTCCLLSVEGLPRMSLRTLGTPACVCVEGTERLSVWETVRESVCICGRQIESVCMCGRQRKGKVESKRITNIEYE
jgi:hypothetical protein